MPNNRKAPVASLYGIGGLYNYGCEAIVRGTAHLLRKACPGVRIRYFTPRAEDDARRVSDLGIEVVQLNPGHRSLPLKVVNKMATVLSIPFDGTREDYGSVLEGTDVLVSIGGDIYTIPSYLRDRRRYPYFNRLVKMGGLALEAGIPEVVIGASLGPFGDYQPAVRYYANHLRDIDLICCREQRSIDYLRSIDVSDNVCLMPDPAFFVEDVDDRDIWSRADRLGVNLSPLSLRELFGGVSDSDVKRLADLVCRLMDQTGLPATLIPHVIAPDPNDNDLLFLRKVAAAMDDAHRARTEVAEPEGFLDAKRVLRSCRFVVAARMHCAVNAMCEGVPTILLSYSLKAKGMCSFVYGHGRWVLPLDEAEAGLPDRLAELSREAEGVHEALIARISSVRGGLLEDVGFNRLESLFDGLFHTEH